MIVFDLEATNLLSNPAVPDEQQPEIVEIAAIRLHPETLEEVGRYNQLVKPKMPVLPEEFIKITGITDAMIADAPSFTRVIPAFSKFVLGAETLIAHNISYDVGVLSAELRRRDWLCRFPWPPTHIDTVAVAMPQFGKRVKLGDLYTHATGLPMTGAHRAMNDVEALVAIVRWAVREELM